MTAPLPTHATIFPCQRNTHTFSKVRDWNQNVLIIVILSKCRGWKKSLETTGLLRHARYYKRVGFELLTQLCDVTLPSPRVGRVILAYSSRRINSSKERFLEHHRCCDHESCQYCSRAEPDSAKNPDRAGRTREKPQNESRSKIPAAATHNAGRFHLPEHWLRGVLSVSTRRRSLRDVIREVGGLR